MEKTGTLSTEIRRGLSTHDFRRVSANGFGDGYNSYPHSMAWFQDHLYVGTSRSVLSARGRWRLETRPDWLGQIWPVRIPDGLFDNDLRSQIWRYHPPTDTWSMVYISPLTTGIDGYQVPLSCGFRAMAVFQGVGDSVPALYVPTWGSHQTPESLMLKSTDGVNFEVVSDPGLGFPDPHQPRGVRAFISFKGRLFSSPAVSRKRRDPNIAGSMIIAETSNPSGGAWRLVNEPNFGDINNLTVFQFGIFNDHLYAGTVNVREGFQIWKTDAEGSAPYTWKKILSNGAYRGKNNQIAATFCVFDGCLYVGSAIQEGGFDLDNRVGPAGVEIIRIHPDDSWDLVVGEPRQTPDGLKVPISAMGPGFDNPFAGYLWAMCNHEGWLYAATFDWLIALRYAKIGEGCPDWLRPMLSAKNLERLILKYGGCELWRTRDGVRWTAVTRNGFDNYYNYGIRNMVSTPYGLFAGTANPYGPEVAIRRTAGWIYENNPRGGLEIWMGVHQEVQDADHLKHAEMIAATEVGVPTDTAVPQVDSGKLLENTLDEFYRQSGFRHLGFWREDIHDPIIACENLMEEMLAFVPIKKGNVVDIGCGFGATTRYLQMTYDPKDITGIACTKQALAHCRKQAPGVNFLARRLPNLELPNASFDLAMFAKHIEPLGSRKHLFGEIYRALKPGGQVVGFDILYEADTLIPAALGHADQAIRSPLQYRELLLGAGFRDVHVMPVTESCLGGFARNLSKFIYMKSLEDTAVDADLKTEMEKVLRLRDPFIDECVLISAVKPE